VVERIWMLLEELLHVHILWQLNLLDLSIHTRKRHWRCPNEQVSCFN
jgi:hypothetical protein